MAITSSEIFDDWLHNLKQFSQKTELFLYWFTSQQAVYDLYSGAEETIQYTLPNNYIIVSDLGPDGFAIVSNEPLSSLQQTQII